MKKYSFLLLTAATAGMLFLNGCFKEPEVKKLDPKLPTTPDDYTTNYRKATGNISIGDNTPGNNGLTNAGATLGRLLFYDPRMSMTNTISCGSCHKQSKAFADDLAFSTGFEGKKTTRNTPAIINAFSKASFFWDGRTSSLEEQTLMPVKNHIEMGMEKTDVLVQKLGKVSYYPDLFQKAFGSTEVTPDKISMALAQFMRSMVSIQSPIDLSALSADQNRGRIAFIKYKCNDCHQGNNFGGAPLIEPYFSTSTPNTSNIGLDTVYADQGIQAITNNNKDNGFFVIPSLRNLAFTAPYMHDGRYNTLEEVVEHYSTGIKAHPNLDPILLQANWTMNTGATTGAPVRMNMTAQEKSDLVAFLKSLSDQSVTTDAKFSNPFK